MQFTFKAVKASGEAVIGRREAADRLTLAHHLRAEQLTLVRAEPAQLPKLDWWRWFGRITLKDKMVFANSLAAMLGSGLSLTRSLDVLQRQAVKINWRRVLTGLNDRIVAGDSFNRALAAFPEVFPTFFVAMVAAGEEAGKMPQALQGIGAQLTKTYELRRKLRGAMIYPAIIILAIIVTALVLIIFLLPALTALFKDFEIELPLATRLMIAVSDFFAVYAVGVVVLISLAGLAGWRFLRTARGQQLLADVNLRLPVLRSLIKNFNSALTLRTLSVLLGSGVSLTDSLRLTQQIIANVYYRRVLAQALEAVQHGKTISAIFHQQESLYPALVGEMAEVGEETGNLSGMLERGAVFFEAEVEQVTKNLSVIIEPVLMVVIGIIVGLFAYSVIGPIYSLINSI